MNTTSTKTTSECCPVFHSEKWDNKTFNWNKKKFLIASIPTLFHIPFPPMIAKKVTKMMKMAEDAHQTMNDKENILLLFTDPHPFKTEMYLSVKGLVPEAKNTTLSGAFISKTFKGDHRDIPNFIKQMDTYLKEQNKQAEEFYVHYAYCPKCAKEAGHNYMVFFAKVGESEAILKNLKIK